ncbi:MAG: hypothetical protein FWG26_09095 [Betaproteobacteria bacterium]|jgi:hypothetical protein|nr:hypothetical protein [Betaproteobacteria bacterium]
MKETVEQIIARVMATPDDKNEPYCFRYYLDTRLKDNPMLYVAMEGPSGGLLGATQGRKKVGWRNEKLILNSFRDDLEEHDIHDGHLLTEAEACDTARSMGLSSIDAVKAKMVNDFTKVNHYPPNIVAEAPEVIIARREKGREEAKWRGWDD